ncbi:MAG: heparinase II/III-family protein, partial [Kiritimatiellae bacterium]|nr:heparinase II/III-family protein [Kiritimatiellia bacterium]
MSRGRFELCAVWLGGLVTMSWVFSAHAKDEGVTLADVRNRVERSVKVRPSVIFTAERVAAWRKAIARAPACRAVGQIIEKRARSLLGQPPCERRLEGRRLLAVSHEANRRIVLLAMAWHQTRDQVFVKRAAEELWAISRFTDWNPSHFLDTAVLAMAAGIGYDSFATELDAVLRNEIRRALVDKALMPSLETGKDGKPLGWISSRNNWNQVCHGGLVVGALAIRGEEPDLAARIVHRAIVNVPRAVSVSEPDGAYPEGPDYWEFGTSFNVYMIEALETSLGTDFGLSNLPGFRPSAAFMLHATGPSGLTFNFADGHAHERRSATLFWFVRRFGDVALLEGAPELAAWSGQPERLGNEPMSVLSVLWHVAYPEKPGKNELPLDAVFRGRVPVVMLRSSWTDPKATYVGIKGGSPAENHGHMDGGSFIFEANGVRWAWDLGAENYHKAESTGMNFWDRSQNGDRWRFFRQGALSHNVLTINGTQQRVDGSAQVTDFRVGVESPMVSLDLTSLYACLLYTS